MGDGGECLRPWRGDVAGAEVGDMIGTAGDGESWGPRMGTGSRRGSWTDLQDANKAASEAAAAEAESLGAAPVCLGAEQRQWEVLGHGGLRGLG